MPRAVVLLSGGLDSSTTAAVAKANGYELFALSVDYGQRHRVELQRAAAVAKAVGVADHRTVKFDLRAIVRDGGSDDELADEIARAVGLKWAGHHIGRVDFVRPDRSMSQIGG